LFAECEQRLGRYLAQMVRDRALAEDLLQDTFIVALRSGPDLPLVTNPEAWLFGIARHRALDALRKRRRFQSTIDRLAARRQLSDEPEAILALRDLLERTLSPEDRSLVLLRYLHDFDATELAGMTGMTADAIRQRLSRARRKLLVASGQGGTS
jgi:RNA polymerase sigma-70 factor (ECF subfamily)